MFSFKPIKNEKMIADGLISGLFNWIAQDSTNRSNERSVYDTNKANLALGRETNALNKEIADKNLQLQQNQFDYQKALNERQMQREDTAYQRTVSDMRAAGLSPLTMTGTNSSSPLTSAEAPQNGMQYQNPATMQAAQKQAPQIQVAGILDSIMSFKKAQSELKSIELDNQSKELENKFSSLSFASRLNQLFQAERSNGFELFNKSLDKRYKEFYGITDSMSDKEKFARFLLGSVGLNAAQNEYNDNINYTTKDGEISTTWHDFPSFNSIDPTRLKNHLKSLIGAMSSDDSKDKKSKNFFGEKLDSAQSSVLDWILENSLR